MAETKPVDVPDEWLVIAHDAYYSDIHPADHIATWRALRAMLAAVLPLHEKQMRERVADDIEAFAESIGWYEGGGVWADAIDVARTGRRAGEWKAADDGH